jgi:hypothetical protein
MSMHHCRMKSFPTSMFDPEVVAPGLFRAAGRRADSYLLIGGATDLAASGTVIAGLDTVTTQRVLATLADGAFGHAATHGLTGAALYVREEQRAAFAGGGRRAEHVGDFATMSVEGSDNYLAGLGQSRRSVVRRDWRVLDSVCWQRREVPAHSVLLEAAPLVVAVNRRHGIPDHDRLAHMRLLAWANERLGVRIAFDVRDETRLLAVAFGCHFDNVLEMYEVGIAEVDARRHLAYVEAVIYAPLRYAARTDCTTIHLGLGSSRPKRLRGARISPVWAVAAEGN